MNDETNWNQLLETPPGWKFTYNDQDYHNFIFDENDILKQLQPSTFDFLNDDEDEEALEAKTEEKEQQQKAYSNGTYVFKSPGFVADSIKFEYVYSEIPSRCIMLSNVSPLATKDDLIYIFDHFGSYESCDLSNISKGIASVTFFNMEDAQMMRVSTIYIRNQQAMKIFYTDTQPYDMKKPKNNGTIVLFHIPKNIEEKELFDIFSKFGKIRQIRSTPTKSYQKFIEFYDIRSAEKALKAYNGKKLTKKSNSKVTIEYSRPGGFKKNIQKYYKTKLPTIERNKNNNKIIF